MSDKPQQPPAPYQLRPHRCNDRLEDAIHALFEGRLREDVLPLARLVGTCIASQPGQEPGEPYRFVQPQAEPVFTTRSRGMRRPDTRQAGGAARAEEQQKKPPQPPPPEAPARRSWWRRDDSKQAS